MKSKIYYSEAVSNKDRHFGSEEVYYPCRMVMPDGTEAPALFTRTQLEVAMGRAKKNPEDVPRERSFLEAIFGSL